jgi:hypothetical protein
MNSKLPPDKELEAFIDRELRQLEATAAPEGLLDSVCLALIQQSRLPWWKRPFRFWPLSCRLLASAVLALLSLALLSVLSSHLIPASHHFLHAVLRTGTHVWEAMLDWGPWLSFAPWVLNLWIDSGGMPTLLIGGTAIYLLLIALGSAFVRFGFSQARGD